MVSSFCKRITLTEAVWWVPGARQGTTEAGRFGGQGSSSRKTRGVTALAVFSSEEVRRVRRRRSSPKLVVANTSTTQVGSSRRESAGPALESPH